MITQYKAEEIKELVFQNKTAKTISLITNLKYHDIINYIKQNNLKEIRFIQNKNQLLYLLNYKNLSRKEIGKILNVSPEKVTFLMTKYNIKNNFRQNNNKKTEKLIIDTYKKTPLSVSEMCQKLKKTYTVVNKVYIKNNLVKIKPKIKHLKVLSEEQYQFILNDLKNTKLSLQKIADKNNCSRQRIFQIQKSNNIVRK